MRTRRHGWVVAVTLALSAVASAEDAAPDGSVPDESRPIYSADARWVRPALWAGAGLFAAAATIGPLVWLRARSTVPSAATHEEDPAAARH